jgi:hypothetical protein
MPKPVRLVLLSGLMLFVELALIRWTGSNIVFLSYFSNFVLLGSFLGIGVGFLRGTAKVDLFPFAPLTPALLVGAVLIQALLLLVAALYAGAFLARGVHLRLGDRSLARAQ